MKLIGKVDLESNKITEYIDSDALEIVHEEEFLIDGSLKIFNKNSNCSIWVSPSLIDNSEVCYLRILPRDSSNGTRFVLIPRIKLIEGSVYLINNNLCYKYKLKFQ